MKNLYPEDIYSQGAGEKFSHLYNIIRSLRGPNGCPWDKEQTIFSLRDSLLEETHELVEAINEVDHSHIKEELGDVLMLLILIMHISEQNKLFTLRDVFDQIVEKLVRRHPHVFADESSDTLEEVRQQWSRIKSENEGRQTPPLILSRHLPIMDQSYSLQEQAAEKGFDWEGYTGVFEKIQEELMEIKSVISKVKTPSSHEHSIECDKELEMELGDLLFAVINLSRKLGIKPQNALLRTNSKFIKRFSYILENMKNIGLALNKENLSKMEEIWQEAKNSE